MTVVWRGFYFGRHLEVCPSPFGRGWRGAPGEGFVACWPSSGPSGHLLPKGEGHARFFANLNNLGIDRPYGTKHVERIAEIFVCCRFVHHLCEHPFSSRRRAG